MMEQTVARTETAWGNDGDKDFPRLLENWVRGPTVEERLMAIFAMVGRKISSDEAALVWQKLLKHCGADLSPEVFEQLTRQLIALAPEYKLAEKLYFALMTSRRRQESSPGIVFMITSCFRYLDKARQVKAELEGRGGHVCIVVGDPSVPSSIAVDDVVKLPVPDCYEALTLKVLEGLTWVRQTYGAVSVAKVDDDMRFNDRFNPSELINVANSLQYAGQLWGGMCDRAWHLGKTMMPTPIYSRRQRGMFAYGPMYLMGPKAVDHLVRTWVHFPGEVAGRIYEDRAIGELLAEGGIPLNSYPIAQMGGVVDQTERLISEATSVKETK